jgi:PPOX class probable F420-dependent enzyme
MGKNQRSKIVMSDDEIAEFIDHSRTATMATLSADGKPHLVAMWYALIDGELWFETKAKSQKAVNLRRDPTITVMIEDGQTYDTLRGVSIDGRAEIVDGDPDLLLRVGISVWERYTGPYTEDMKPFVDQMMNNRVAVRVVPSRLRSWDHRKLDRPWRSPYRSARARRTMPPYRSRSRHGPRRSMPRVRCPDPPAAGSAPGCSRH